MTFTRFNRRNFLQLSGLAALHLCTNNVYSEQNRHMVMTVTGSIPASSLGSTLSHEHVMVDFIGANDVSPSRYNRNEVFKKAEIKLKELKAVGCKTLIECTPAYLGRDVQLLKELALSTGLTIITNTGYYGAVNEKYLPYHVHTESAEKIADRWINEFKNGIEGTGIRPGMIKTSVDKLPFTPAQEKMIEAAAITHLETGLTIGVHTGNGEAAIKQLEILDKHKVHPSAWIWIHAQNEKNTEYFIKIAKRGGWIEMDGLGDTNAEEYLKMLTLMKQHRQLHKVLISQDSGWYHVGEEGGGLYKGYTFIHQHFIPAMLKEGFQSEDVHKILIQNPAAAFGINKRRK